MGLSAASSSKGKGAAGPVQDVVSSQEEGPEVAVLSKRIRGKKKKLNEIKLLEEKIQNGMSISTEQQEKVRGKQALTIEVKELETMKEVLRKAIEKEINKASVPDPAKKAEASFPDVVAEVELDDDIEKQCYSFLKEYKLHGDDMPLYHGDALALVSRRRMRLLYSDICMHDRQFAMKVCADYERLKPSITHAAKRFAKEVLQDTIKVLTPEKANAVIHNVETLQPILAAKPRSHQTLDAVLQPRSVVMDDVETSVDNENPMKTPSDVGAAVLVGTLQELISKQLEGLSCNGHLGIGNIEIYNGQTFVINSPMVWYAPGSKEWAEACKKDFESYANAFPPLFKTGNTYTPYMLEFKATLSTVPLDVLQSREQCLAFHEFVLDHMAGKPIPVRSALIAGIHTCCNAFDLKDPVAPFKDTLHEIRMQHPVLGRWPNAVRQSGNHLMQQLLTKKLKDGRVIPCKYEDDLESLDTYLRVLNEHGTNYTKDKKLKNQPQHRGRDSRNSSNQSHNTGQRMQNWSQNVNRNMKQNQNTNSASTSQQPNEPEVQHQRVKLLNELEMCGSRHLAPYICEMIYALIKKKAMTGMLLPIWKAFKSCKYTLPESKT